MTGFDFESFDKAPKGAAKGKCLPAPKLAYELAVATLRLSLDPARPPIHRPTVQAVSPVLKAAYTKAQSTIPTYPSVGRSEDGLGLHRPKAGPYPVCRENAGLCLKRLKQLGHPPSKVAALLAVPSETKLLAALAALPSYDEAVAASLAAPRPSSRPAADAGDAAGQPAERKETAKADREEARRAAREQAILAKEKADREEEARKREEREEEARKREREEAERKAEQDRLFATTPDAQELLDQLTDDEQ